VPSFRLSAASTHFSDLAGAPQSCSLEELVLLIGRAGVPLRTDRRLQLQPLQIPHGKGPMVELYVQRNCDM